MWEQAVQQTVKLCSRLAELYQLDKIREEMVTIDWGNGTLYDEDKTWSRYVEMVEAGMLKPEIALGWRFNLPVETGEDLQRIRTLYMPDDGSTA